MSAFFSTRTWRAAALLAAAFCAGHATSAFAHDPGLSSLELRIGSGQIEATLSLSAADARAAVRDTAGSLDALALESIDIRIDGIRLTGAVARRPLDSDTGTTVHLTFERPGGSGMTVRSGVPLRLAFGHRELLRIRGADGQLLADRMLDATSDEIAIALDLGTPGATTAEQFFALGIRHILGGYDHLLFLGALLLGVRRLGDVVRTVTAFTVAHSITLALAVLEFVRVPAAIVEPLIAASIVCVGLENLWRRQMDSRWKPTFAFGLVHGLGFAGALQELGLGARGVGVAMPLGLFNVGIEIGQAGVAALLWPLIRRLNAQPALRIHLAPMCSWLVVAAGTYWLVERTLF